MARNYGDTMLGVPTVFVLGAGASAPYRFPTGLGLSKLIVQELAPGHACYVNLQNLAAIQGDDVALFRGTSR
jgi:hypothetical protein